MKVARKRTFGRMGGRAVLPRRHAVFPWTSRLAELPDLITAGGRAEGNGQPVPAVDRDDGEREIDQLLFAEAA